jgi:DNA topoisomerase-1
MGKPLIIVESPAKAKTISKYLDERFIVKASMGHIRDLPKSDLGVDIEKNFEPKYVTDPAKSKLISELKAATKSASAIYLAPDHDREGEAIAWHLANVLEKETGKKPVYRVVFNEITKKAIQVAVDSPGQIDINKVDSQQARRILDRIVGYKISPMLWKLINRNLSAGRVQSVALRLICERDDEIKAFVAEEYWSIETEFYRDKLPAFKAELAQFNGKKATMKTEAQAQAILAELKNKKSEITGYKKSERDVQPPAPYITSTLQQDASRLINFTGKKTMTVAQKLYEGLEIGGEMLGLITYMRTDSVRISNEANTTLREFIARQYGKEKLHSTTRVYKNKNAAQDAHEAIRPTYPERTPSELKPHLSNDEYRLYDLIWKRFTATQMKPVRLSTVSIEITTGKALFKTSGSVFVDKGFYDVYPHISLSTGEDIDPGYAQNDSLQHNELLSKQHFTKPPAYFTEAQLVKELEANGIGRPSTYASITNTIVARKYVEVIEKKFHPTDLGHMVNKFLVAHFDTLFNVKFTAEMENKLDDIEYGKQVWQQLLSEYYVAIKSLMEKVNIADSKKELIEQVDFQCEKCGKPMVIKIIPAGQFLGCSGYPQCKNLKRYAKDTEGKIKTIETTAQETDIACEKCGAKMHIKKTRTGKDFLGCSGYPKCKNAKDFTTDAQGKIEIVTEKQSIEKCDLCGSEMVYKYGKFGEFLGCSSYPKCKGIKNIPLGVDCPKCIKGSLIEKRLGKKPTFYGCSRYPECDFITSHKPVPTKCVECGNPYLEQHKSKTGDVRLVCPNCKKEFF